MRGRDWALTVAAGALASALALSSALADDQQAEKTGAGTKTQVLGAGSGSSQGAAGNNAVDNSNGVAGTGLGKMPNTQMGTGNSVKGPAGQGIPQTDTVK